jgi:hypothetical protein
LVLFYRHFCEVTRETFQVLKPDRSTRLPRLEPIRSCDDLAQEEEKDAKENYPASDPRTRTSFAESKVVLQPIEQRVQQKKLQQSRETSLTIAH